MNLIEKLKDKTYVRAFGLMSEEEQKVFEKVGRKNCFMYNGDGWYSADYYRSRLFPTPTDTYAITPDYQPEPEYIDCTIKEHQGILGIWARDGVDFCRWPFIHLHCLPSLPNFMYFWKDDGGYKMHNEIYETGMISLLIQNKAKVYARFRSVK